MKARILCVYDEGALEATPFIGAKGASMLIEVDGQRTLFGTGMRSRYLAHNMDHLEIDPESLDRVVVSHGHRDHVGGLGAVLSARRSPIGILASPSSAGRKGPIRSHGIRIPSELADMARVGYVEDWTALSDNLHITPPLPFPGGDECFLVLTTADGPVVLSGCSHCGPEAVAETVRDRFGRDPRAYIGGLHIVRRDKVRARAAAEFFKGIGCSDLRLNHCTCPAAITDIRGVLGSDAVGDFHVGMAAEYEV